MSWVLGVIGMCLAACALGLALTGWRAARRVQARHDSLEASIAALRRELELLTSISVRTGRRVQRVEHDYSGVAERVDLVESRGAATGSSLDQAIDWARRGADSERLAQEFGLSSGEAELVARLHGRTKSA